LGLSLLGVVVGMANARTTATADSHATSLRQALQDDNQKGKGKNNDKEETL
jgi:hypothetical protein